MATRIVMVLVCLATALNVGILIVRIFPSSSVASVAGLDQQALTRDPDFVRAVQ